MTKNALKATQSRFFPGWQFRTLRKGLIPAPVGGLIPADYCRRDRISNVRPYPEYSWLNIRSGLIFSVFLTVFILISGNQARNQLI